MGIDLLIALGLPLLLLIIGLLWFQVNGGMPVWLERVGARSGLIWNIGIISIILMGIVKFLISN
ncbi:MAG: hypothetical protein AB8A41_06920 [Prochlorococcus sp.]|jgi:uncharacterized membrane protein YvlD (DUF360 family)|nr:hypothetical protein [Prochlorococcaceae cyanobacterium ETNP1_MAG_8]|tara:strand:+ start:321 stop:512 length:192 start_codon:yes stop_codon:yes gene_type:complete